MTATARLAVAAAVFGALALVPLLDVGTYGVFSGELNSPGTLQVLALCLVLGGVALTYDLQFGFTGLLSFGHALPFAIGVYITAIGWQHWDLGFLTAIGLALLVGLAAMAIIGSIALRVAGIAFAMVTLAFAQAGTVLIAKNPDRLTGGEEGVGLVDVEMLPESFVGVLNTRNLYWLALGYLVVVAAAAWWAIDSSPGRVWQAIRENERRVEVLGLRPFPFKLTAFVLSSLLAVAGGVVYVLLIGGATPEVATASFTLALLLMVVIGGTGTRWGAILGGVLYTYLDNRLLALGGSERIEELPRALRIPLSEPLFVLGVLFILIVFFVPGGIAGLGGRRRHGLALLESSVRQPAAAPASVEADEETRA